MNEEEKKENVKGNKRENDNEKWINMNKNGTV